MADINYRPSRVFAMQVLYALELTGGTPGDVLNAIEISSAVSLGDGVMDAVRLTPETKNYGMKLVDLVLEHREQLDAAIKESTVHWDIERIAKVDRIIIQIAMVEILYIVKVPVRVVIAEANKISAKFSTDNSSSFVSGILSGFMEKRGIKTSK